MTARTSSRVQLEVAILDDGDGALTSEQTTAPDERPRVTVLVVAAESDLRRYVRECLRERSDLRVLEAATVGAAVALAAEEAPVLLIVDEPERDVLASLSDRCAIVIVDELSRDALAPGARVRQLARPFACAEMLAEVGLLLG